MHWIFHQKTVSEDAEHISTAKLCSSDLNVQLDNASLSQMISCLSLLFSSAESNEETDQIRSKPLLINRFEVELFGLSLSWNNPKEFLPDWNILKKIFPNSTFPWDSILNLDDVHLKMESWIHEGCSLTISELSWELLVDYLANQFLKRIIKLVASLDVFGNVSGVFDTITEATKQIRVNFLEAFA